MTLRFRLIMWVVLRVMGFNPSWPVKDSIGDWAQSVVKTGSSLVVAPSGVLAKSGLFHRLVSTIKALILSLFLRGWKK
ncbi:hypothetical protein M407DRAFT_185273 [Tulasnella calospora MUT 4182]|uniref:Uncharacterized protein n=1 Tax=Tulasnella calospora MUT 4182 TaxID=1051891 RepID=A0A0C3QBQ4_9AGAM|nr:hypothetical protein M407DRAFT_185273 [Tulasnella calospora MUT 4182]